MVPSRNISTRTWVVIMAIPIIAGLLFILRNVDPMTALWMPKCMFKTFTGLDCPSCGATRAAHAILNGNLKEAFLFNPFLAIGLIYLGLVVVVTYLPVFKKTNLKKFAFGKSAAFIYISLYVVWGVVRNIYFR